MLDQLINLVKEHAGEAIINNPAIPNERNDEAVQTASEGIFEGLKNQISNGGLESITGLFQGNGDAKNAVMSAASSNVAQQLMQKFGIDQNQAGGIVQSLIPTVMEKFVNKTNDPNDSSFNASDILQSLTSGSSGLGNIGGMIGNLFK